MEKNQLKQESEDICIRANGAIVVLKQKEQSSQIYKSGMVLWYVLVV